MKKLLFASLCALTIMSCSNDQEEIIAENQAQNLALEKDSKKTAKSGWEKGITRFYSNTLMKHFYASPGVMPPGFPSQNGWRDEGIAFVLGGEFDLLHQQPLYSMINPGNADFLIVPAHDVATLTAQGYQQVEMIGYGYTSNATPVYRYYSPSRHRHFFTTNWNELGNGGNGWVYEGVFFYAK